MKATLNIGLTKSNKFQHDGMPLRPVYLIPKLADFGMEWLRLDLQQSETEMTLIAEVEFDGRIEDFRREIHALADWACQDCIAAQFTGLGGFKHGELIGTYAADWGAFDEKYFIK